jgi:hypothetical protein
VRAQAELRQNLGDLLRRAVRADMNRRNHGAGADSRRKKKFAAVGNLLYGPVELRCGEHLHPPPNPHREETLL